MLYKYVFMYVYMYVCMYVCTYTYVCIYHYYTYIVVHCGIMFAIKHYVTKAGVWQKLCQHTLVGFTPFFV